MDDLFIVLRLENVWKNNKFNLIKNFLHQNSLESGSTSALENSNSGDYQDLDKPKQRCLNQTNWMSDQELRESKAASLVCRALAVNAYRKKRAHVEELKSTVTDFGQQLDHLQLQILVLRKLLDKENSRVAGLGGELHKAKTQIEEITKDRDQLKIVSFLPQLCTKLWTLFKNRLLYEIPLLTFDHIIKLKYTRRPRTRN